MTQTVFSFKNVFLSQKKKIVWLIFIIIGITTMPPPATFGGVSLDGSGLIAVPWIALKNLQIGHDVNMIFGPLGYLYSKSFVAPTGIGPEGSLWVESLIYGLFVHFFFIFSIALLTTRLSTNWKDYLLVFLALPSLSFLTNNILNMDDKLEISLAIFLYLLITHKIGYKYKTLLLFFVSFSLAIEFLIKLDMSVEGLSIITIFSLISIAKKEPKNALAISASYILFIVALWIIANQHLANLPSYFINGIELSSGYTYGDAIDGPKYQVYEAVAGLIFVIVLFIYSLIKKAKNLTMFILLTGVLLFAAFKHGFVRQDLHVVFYFWTYGVFFISAYLISKSDTEQVLRDKKKFIITIILVLAVVGCVTNLDYLLPDLILPDISKSSPPPWTMFPLIVDESYQTQMIQDFKNTSKNYYNLDQETIQYIGNKTLDILPWDIALPWGYGFNWSPNPTWQSFMILTPQSDVMNANYFLDEKRAPQTILYTSESIDGRYPPFDAPLTFASIVNNYQYIRTTGQFVLLSHSSEPHTQGSEVDLGTMEAKIGEPIKIPQYDSGYEFAHIDLKFNTFGKLMNILYKPALAHMRFKFSDQMYSDEFKFIPMVSNDGVFVSQYVGSVDDLRSIFSGRITSNISDIIIDVDNPAEYENNVQVKFVGIPAEISVQKSNETNKMPNWQSLKLIQGGSMSIDWIGDRPYGYGQEPNVINLNETGLQFIDIRGWAFDNLAKDGTVKTFLAFHDNGSEIILPTRKEPRPDLVPVFGVDSYRDAGWETVLDSNEFGHGCYTLSLLIPRSNNQEYFEIGGGGKLICFGYNRS